jgi:hypothetical protein
MTEQPDNKKKDQTPVSVGEEDHRHDGAVNVRRALLKGAVGTMPMILTLQSGAALARSSNMISAATYADSQDADGRTLCLDYTYTTGIFGDTSQVDVGEPPYVHVSAIREGDYSLKKGGELISREKVCNDGGVYAVKPSQGGYYDTNNVPRGMLVSATALSSFTGHITTTEI